MAHAHDVPMAPHCVISPIGAMGAGQVCTAIPNFPVLAWHWIQRLDLWQNTVKAGDIIGKGSVTVPMDSVIWH